MYVSADPCYEIHQHTSFLPLIIYSLRLIECLCGVFPHSTWTLRLYLMDFPHDALKSASSFFLCSFCHFVTVVLQFVATSRNSRKQLGKICEINAGITQIPGQCLI